MKVRKRPVVVEALQYIGTRDNWEQIRDMGSWDEVGARSDTGVFSIFTREGEMLVEPGDWVIRGVHGELYPCKDSIFRATYDPVDEQEAGR